MAYTVHLSQFDGPLDLLLHLISKAKVDIRDIFVSQITQQYLHSLGEVSLLDMDTASEFLAMAATLLEIKSRALLPRPPKIDEDEQSPEEMLIQRLEEYKRLKELAGDMRLLEEASAQLFAKLPEEYPLPPPSFALEGLTLEGLTAAFASLLSRAPQEEEAHDSVSHEVVRDMYSVQDCMLRIVSRLKQGKVAFSQLFLGKARKGEIVSVFIAMLELLKLGHLRLVQSELYEEIMIFPSVATDKITYEET